MDDLTFRVQFAGDGAARLRDRVKEKLKEFMGDYTDDTLVEYVIVLLKNGRRKEEAKNELNVFLGDDSDSFVSWLWDHLQSNIDLYVQPGESCADEAKPKSTSGEQGGKTDPLRLDSEPEKENSNKLSKRRHIKEWKGLVRDADEPPPLRSAVITNIHREEETNQNIGQTKRSLSPRPSTQRKRSRPDERPQREVVSKGTNSAPRRLLQFAVRDAVATSRPSSLTTVPSLKRLRSVVSTSTDDISHEGRPQRIRSVARVPNAMAVAIKAVAEAAKDVVKVKPSGNVFDRLGPGMDVSDTTDHLTEYREPFVEYDGEYRGFTQVPEETHSTYHQLHKNGQSVRNMSMLESDAGMGSDFVSDSEDYDNVTAQGRRVMDVSETGTSGLNKGDDSLMVQYVANDVDEIARNPRNVQDQPAANTSSKTVNISANVNTWKPPHYQEPRGGDVENQQLVHAGEPGVGKSGVRLMKENSNPVAVSNGNAIPTVDAQRESQKTLPSAGIYSTGRPTEDADSRTIFVSNVHFAATKDSLSRHFNKFGEVLKVVIVTDAATGQPKGSAYVEFMRKEAAEHALSLDGASFMSRILKVVRKSSAQQEAAPAVTWPRVARGSPFGASRFARGVPYPRGMPSMYRPPLPIKLGARSLQWKRGDAQSSTPSENSALASGNPIPSPTSRSLTYVRTEPKTNGNSGTV